MGIRSLDAVEIKEVRKGFKEEIINKHEELGKA